MAWGILKDPMKDKLRLVAIIRNIEPSVIVPIAEALIDGGIKAIEVSLSDPQKGFACLERLQERRLEGLLLGAGTVTRRHEVERLAAMGIQYFFCAGFDAAIVDYAADSGLLAVPGVLSPSEVQQGMIHGLKLLKIFPANAFPLRYLKDLQGPFPGLDFLAVGGLSPDNLGEYLKAGYWGAGIGSSLVPYGAGREQLPRIRGAAKKCAAILKGSGA
jgi:2-dehydro-3-deoxyphosphogluconate aldolase/(4S)-4-hydroxy-2-oxoglutarate aldolase